MNSLIVSVYIKVYKSVPYYTRNTLIGEKINGVLRVAYYIILFEMMMYDKTDRQIFTSEFKLDPLSLSLIF